MRHPDDVAALARTRYRRTWRDTLTAGVSEPVSFNLNAPTAAATIADPTAVAAWLNAWRGYGTTWAPATLRPNTIRTAYGDQPVHTHLDVPDTTALAAFNPDTQEHWNNAQTRWARLRPLAADTSRLRPWLGQIVELPEVDFALLLAAAEWFRCNPRSGLTIRRVPVPGMHTKWLARHRRLVIAMLGQLIESETTDVPAAPEDAELDVADIPDTDLDALGLRPIPREADILLADPHDRQALGGLRHLRAPIDELDRLPLNPRWVLVVENKEAALSLNDTVGLVIIHSLGNHLEALRHIPWIPHHSALYWGDIDRHGYTLLSRARSAVPGLTSVLMSREDVAKFHYLAVMESLTRYDPADPNLEPAEQCALDALTVGGQYLRIEQERIPIDVAERTIHAAMSEMPAV